MAPDTLNKTAAHGDLFRTLHYTIPALILIYFLMATIISVCTLQNLKARSKRPYKVLLSIQSLILVSYIAESSMLVAVNVIMGRNYYTKDHNIYTLSSTLIWMLLVMSLLGAHQPVMSYPYYGSWLIAFIGEATLFGFKLDNSRPCGAFEFSQTVVQVGRILLTGLLPTILFLKSTKRGHADEESAPLLGHDKENSKDTQQSKASSSYGSSTAFDDADLEFEESERMKDAKQKEQIEKRLQAHGNWIAYASAFSIFIPYLWPSRQPILQARMSAVCLCLLCGRALNVLEPRQWGIVLDSLSRGQIPTSAALLLVLYRWIDSSVVGPFRRWLWEPVELNAEASMKTASYNHIMGLSRDFHTEKQSGELYESIEQGTTIISLLHLVLFQLLPLIVDLAVAFAYLYYVFGSYMALIVAATTAIYLGTSNCLIGYQTKLRRRVQGLSRKGYQLMYDTMGGWNTVTYFNRLNYEKERYHGATVSCLKAEQNLDSLYRFEEVVQDTILEFGLIAAGALALYQLANGSQQRIGNFAMLIDYWANFTGKLSYVAAAQAQLIHALVDAEMLLDLFHKKPTVKDGSQSFQFSRGVVKFNSVRFSYDGKKDIIQDFNLQAEPGQKIALIGETGGGKSTILKLLFRFYDVKEGTIMVDDQDIRSVTLGSLRQHIGVVPQDPSLFNDSIVNNVRYARLTATDEEVIAACKGAAIHDKITTFTDGYATKVGENGVKLSGGELQRIAIARVILQNPEIILLDEATSSVDTETEAKIQDALQVLTKGRTTFTVAHRLSTVISADIILVIKDGMIAEQGSPHDLLKAKGKYFALWTKQFGINSPPSDDELKPAILIELPDAAHNKDNKDSSESASSGTKSLRADAPEFIPHKDLVPHKQRGTAAEGGEPSHERSESGHQQGYDSVDAKKGGNQMEQNQKSKASVDELEPMSNSILSDSRPTVSDSKHGSASQTDSKKKQYIPFQRGGNKKSEPSGSGLKHNQHEGPSDDAGENSATSIKSLRVSAPTDPSSGPNSAHGVNRGQSRRRHRTARVKKAAQSEATSGEGSRAGSSSSLYFPATNEPSTTSTVLAGTSAASLSDAVQFTPGK